MALIAIGHRLLAGFAAGLMIGAAAHARAASAATGTSATTALDRITSAAPPATIEPIVAARPVGTPPIANPLSDFPLRSLAATRDRPLFSPSRRPPAPVAAAPVVAPIPPPPPPVEPDHPLLELVGTIVGDPEGIGVFVDAATKAIVRLKTGQDHGGWILRSVGSREAKFEKDWRRATLVLQAPGAGSPGMGAQSAARTGETWRDGDGRLISPPPSRKLPRPVASQSGDQL